MLDIFAVDEAGQIQYLRDTWLPAQIATGVPVAISSGNHDGSAAIWLAHINDFDDVIGDGSTKVVRTPCGERLVVSTLPYRSFRQHDPETTSVWDKGAQLRDRKNLPWLVLHHEPLAVFSSAKTITTHWLASYVEQYQPDFVSSGHFHEGGDNNFAHRVGNTWLFNAGQRLDAPRPNHIVLDTSTRTASRARMRPLAGNLSWFPQQSVINL